MKHYIFPLKILFLLYLFVSCKEIELKREAKVETDSTSNITTNSVIVHSQISDLGEGILSYGHCWDSIASPIISDLSDNYGIPQKEGYFQSVISKLQPNTQYFVRSYAKYNGGICYGKELQFKTSSLGAPFVETGEVRKKEMDLLIIRSNILDLGAGTDSIIQYGHCWSLSGDPTIQDSFSNLGGQKSLGHFLDTLSNLIPGKEYHVRAYAINKVGINYGKPLIVYSGILPVLTLSEINAVNHNSFQYKANVLHEGGSSISATGVCWDTAVQPTLEDNYSINGNDIGIVLGKVTELSRTTNYFVRAYATNYFGTTYSNQIELTTLPELPQIQTITITNIEKNSAKSGGIILDDGGADLLDKGISLSTSPDFNSYETIKEGIGSTNFTTKLVNLNELTTYFIKAYATNQAGTAYGEPLTFSTSSSDSSKFVDIDGNKYTSIVIGTQTWMGENLSVTRYNDGTSIQDVTNYFWEWYNINRTPAIVRKIEQNRIDVLYNWYVIDYASNNGKNVCPVGWHIPTDAEWIQLTDYLGGADIAGGKLKDTDTTNWYHPNAGATNEVGFTAIPCGYSDRDGVYTNHGLGGYWWTSTKFTNDKAWYREMSPYNSIVYRDINDRRVRMSVRCVKD